MTPIVRTFERVEEVHTSGISKISLEDKGTDVAIYQNDELITILTVPIMKLVRKLRKHYGDNAKLELI